MSKPRYNWWPYVLNMIRDYPIRKRDYDALHQQTITASTSGMPGGGGASRTTEQIALRQLPKAEQREYDAVTGAFKLTEQMPDHRDRIKVVELTMIRNWYSIGGAAVHLNIQEGKAKQYRWEFIMTVAYTYGLIEKEEYTEVLKKRKIKRSAASQSQKDGV